MSARLRDEAVDHGKSKPRAFWPRGFVVKNGSNAFATTSGGMQVPVLHHAHRDILTDRQILLACCAFIQPLVGSLNRGLSASRHRIAGIEGEVEQRVFQLPDIEHHGADVVA